MMSQSTPLKKDFEIPNLPNLPSPSPSNKLAGMSSALWHDKFLIKRFKNFTIA